MLLKLTAKSSHISRGREERYMIYLGQYRDLRIEKWEQTVWDGECYGGRPDGWKMPFL